MNTFVFSEIDKREIHRVLDYAVQNLYDMDDLLDMKNGRATPPGENPNHLARIHFGQWVCYYLVDDPILGHSHHFHIKPDTKGQLPEKPLIDSLIKEFGIERPLLHSNIRTNHGDIPKNKPLEELLSEFGIVSNNIAKDKMFAETYIKIQVEK